MTPPPEDRPSESPEAETRPSNRLAAEKSPYLLQHAHNPVDWLPWGSDAFERARREDRPIFLSIGYSTCHWCHVMERESFEDDDVAALLNDGFVSIKVDREERPDVDDVYMTVCQMISGHGGWPLTVVLTPDLKPFFAGTYFPRDTRGGRIGMLELLPRLRTLWDDRRSDVEASAESIVEALRRASEGHGERVAAVPLASQEAAAGAGLSEDTLRKAYAGLAAVHDPHQGGFGRAPKFPTPHNLFFLLRWHDRTGQEPALEMIETTLRAMRRGGIFDHVGFGFHRYSTDPRWLVPHFEKMLYDQALLAIAYTETWLVTGRDEHRRVAEEIFEYVLRDMTSEDGGFYSAEDADSEGREGKFYLWAADELTELLGEEDSALVRRVYNVERRGNFAEESTGERTGENILHLREPLDRIAAQLADLRTLGAEDPAAELRARLEPARRTLFEAREGRVHPLKDDKILTDWNGLMIWALALAGRSFGQPAYTEAADRAASFILRELRDDEGSLLHRFREGEAAISATAADYAYLALGLIELYEATFEPRWLAEARRLVGELVARFWDEEGGGFYTAEAGTELPVRQKEVYDGATPSANAVAWYVLLRLARLTGELEHEERAARVERAFAGAVAASPGSHTMWMTALDFRLGPSHEVVVAGEAGAEDTDRLLRALQGRFLPRASLLFKPRGDSGALEEIAPFTEPYGAVNGKAVAYVCTDFACRQPTGDEKEMLAALEAS